MNKARLLLLLLLLATLSGSVCMHPATLHIVGIDGTRFTQIPADYYRYAPIIPPRVDLYEWLGSDLEWSREYEMDVWDCSTQTAYMDWVLTNAGAQTKIYAGYHHAWLLVWRPDKDAWWVYECTNLHWVSPWVGGRYYNPEVEWDNIYELRSWYKRFTRYFALEWCWWTEYRDPWQEVR